ncbi:uncharacterized protein KY384_001410 [Bacidia gigantensis]|uniref:uncharacterized protein n=1 Tax=Bacidia gigantensis TaxID=2732470 RepID=UPI001D03DA0A|nr:uncharacterized protein KY384_001410 [Bacidia gigantensis]KAG8533669.1 hypothetical protein KY384_001410 [Bacidia gigantensis]
MAELSDGVAIRTITFSLLSSPGLFFTFLTIHYIYRSYLFPYLQPSMSPAHIGVAIFALSFQITNGIAIGGWLGSYGPTTSSNWAKHDLSVYLGTAIWALGLGLNVWHDDILRSIRRRRGVVEKGSGEKVYEIPTGGLFEYVFFPHYFTEWVEWAGWWIVGGVACPPARIFLVNEIATMLPRALQGKRWYVSRFGEKKCEGKKAVVPGLI